jgi:hypothetical protein
MKYRILIAAGLLGLGSGPAFAFAIPAMAPDMAKAVKDIWADQMAAQKPAVLDTGAAWMSDAKPGKPEDKIGATETTMVAAAKPVDPTLAGELGGASTPAGAQYNGVGGPLEEVDYPPCSRTVTDRCIQLYERGVHR